MRITNKQIISIGVVLIFGGIFLLCNNYFQSKKAKAYDTITLAMSQIPTYIDSEDIINDEIEQSLEETIIDDDNNNNNNDDTSSSSNNEVVITNDYYIGKLEIPSINFSRGFASLDSKYNDVNKNIAIINGSTYPDVVLGNFILAGHSGSSWNAFFNNLLKLEKGNKAYIYYDNVKYTYELSDIYEEDKTGTVTIKRDFNKTTLTLVTCTRYKKNRQSIYIFYLTEKVYY